MRTMSMALIAAALGGCLDAGDPVAGTWSIQRSAIQQPGGTCHAYAPDLLDVTIAPGATPPISSKSAGVFNAEVTGTHVAFSAAEFSIAGEPESQLVVAYSLDLQGDQLVGTARAEGDGPDLGCMYTMTATGQRPLRQ